MRLRGVLAVAATLVLIGLPASTQKEVGTMFGNPLFAQGVPTPLRADVELIANNGAFEFDGVSSGMSLGRSSILKLLGGDFTIHAWVRFASFSNGGGPCYGPGCDMSIVDKMRASNGDGWRLLKQSDNRFWFCLGGGCEDGGATTVISQTRAVTGLWYSVAVVKTSSQISIYVNGILEGTTLLGAFSDSNEAALRVGDNVDEGAFLHGQVAEVQLFRSALSGPHVVAMFQQRPSLAAAGRAYEPGEQQPVVDSTVGGLAIAPWQTLAQTFRPSQSQWLGYIELPVACGTGVLLNVKIREDLDGPILSEVNVSGLSMTSYGDFQLIQVYDPAVSRYGIWLSENHTYAFELAALPGPGAPENTCGIARGPAGTNGYSGGKGYYADPLNGFPFIPLPNGNPTDDEDLPFVTLVRK